MIKTSAIIGTIFVSSLLPSLASQSAEGELLGSEPSEGLVQTAVPNTPTTEEIMQARLQARLEKTITRSRETICTMSRKQIDFEEQALSPIRQAAKDGLIAILRQKTSEAKIAEILQGTGTSFKASTIARELAVHLSTGMTMDAIAEEIITMTERDDRIRIIAMGTGGAIVEARRKSFAQAKSALVQAREEREAILLSFTTIDASASSLARIVTQLRSKNENLATSLIQLYISSKSFSSRRED